MWNSKSKIHSFKEFQTFNLFKPFLVWCVVKPGCTFLWPLSNPSSSLHSILVGSLWVFARSHTQSYLNFCAEPVGTGQTSLSKPSALITSYLILSLPTHKTTYSVHTDHMQSVKKSKIQQNKNLMNTHWQDFPVGPGHITFYNAREQREWVQIWSEYIYPSLNVCHVCWWCSFIENSWIQAKAKRTEYCETPSPVLPRISPENEILQQAAATRLFVSSPI